MAEKDSSKKVTTKKPAAHPPAAEMVATAITELKDRNGSSLQAIKKYIATNFDVQMDRQLLFIKRALKSGVEKGKLVQTKGKGASGSFKLNVQAAKAQASEKAKKEKEKAKLLAQREKAKEKATAKKEKLQKAAAAKKVKAAPKKAKKPVKKTTEKKEKKKTPKKAPKKPAAKKSTPKKTPNKAAAAAKKPKTAKPKKPAAKKTAKAAKWFCTPTFSSYQKRLFSEPPHTQERTLVQMYWDTMIMCNEEEEGKKKGVKQRNEKKREIRMRWIMEGGISPISTGFRFSPFKIQTNYI